MPFYEIRRLAQEFIIVEADSPEQAMEELDVYNYFWRVIEPTSIDPPRLIEGSELCERDEHDHQLLEEHIGDAVMFGLQCRRCQRYVEITTVPDPKECQARIDRIRGNYAKEE